MRFIALLLALGFHLQAATPQTRPGDVLWKNALDSEEDFASGNGAGERTALSGRPGVLFLKKPGTDGASLYNFELPAGKLRGNWIYLSADVKAKDVSAKPLDWNGVKVILEIVCPDETHWPQIPLPVGTFDWRKGSLRTLIPADATAIKLHIGLDSVSGEVWFDNLAVSLAKATEDAPPAPADQPIFKGHKVEALRGVMAHPRISKEDIRVLAEEWNGNLIRYQLLHMPERGTENDLGLYDEWLERELKYLDDVIGWCREFGVAVVVDLHSPPGGNLSDSGTVNASGPFWSNADAQAHFIDVWKRITEHYKGEGMIWGFDLLNEPEDRTVTEGCADWQSLADLAARTIREIDPERTLIVEPPKSGGPTGFIGFQPIDLPRIVYSFHMYEPFVYTHQGVVGGDAVFTYPGEIDGKAWDKSALAEYMAPAVEFASKYRVQLYVGEFSVIRWAPGADRYLEDVTALFESHGWDWSYHSYREWHGWNLELGTSKVDEETREKQGARLGAILEWFEKNEPIEGGVDSPTQ